MTPFLGQLMLTAFNFAPRGFALCNGQLMPLNQNQALFSLLGTTFGGDGRTTFGLPDLRGRVAISSSSTYALGALGGSESVTLTIANIAAHTHSLTVTNVLNGIGITVQGASVGSVNNSLKPYDPSANGTMAAQAIMPTGGSQPHENRSPFLTMNWIIALSGIFPSRN